MFKIKQLTAFICFIMVFVWNLYCCGADKGINKKAESMNEKKGVVELALAVSMDKGSEVICLLNNKTKEIFKTTDLCCNGNLLLIEFPDGTELPLVICEDPSPEISIDANGKKVWRQDCSVDFKEALKSRGITHGTFKLTWIIIQGDGKRISSNTLLFFIDNKSLTNNIYKESKSDGAKQNSVPPSSPAINRVQSVPVSSKTSVPLAVPK